MYMYSALIVCSKYSYYWVAVYTYNIYIYFHCPSANAKVTCMTLLADITVRNILVSPAHSSFLHLFTDQTSSSDRFSLRSLLNKVTNTTNLRLLAHAPFRSVKLAQPPHPNLFYWQTLPPSLCFSALFYHRRSKPDTPSAPPLTHTCGCYVLHLMLVFCVLIFPVLVAVFTSTHMDLSCLQPVGQKLFFHSSGFQPRPLSALICWISQVRFFTLWVVFSNCL